MFDWCKDVRIYNVHNDYHYYLDGQKINNNQYDLIKLRPPRFTISHKNNI